MKMKLLAAAITLAAAEAQALKGKVINQNGDAIADAYIEVIGAKDVYRSDKLGQFNIPLQEVDEIHIEAKGFSHKILHLHGEYDEPLSITLTKGVMEFVDVVGIPIHASTIESAQPVSVLAGDELRKRQADTLGETLKNEVGVHSTYYGGVSSSPIIRGLDGPRVLITQNGLDASDASRVGPDHVVAAEASTAEQIEILRGPATLFYGSGAIGGVVNIVDDRVPQESEQKGAFLTEYNSVNDETAVSAAYTGGTTKLAFHLDGFWRESNDIDIPESASLDDAEGASGSIVNSSAKSSGFNLGGSLLLDNGFIGLSYGRLDRLNGIPGHAHDEHEEHEEHGEDAHEEMEDEERILSELKQNRWQFISEINVDTAFLAAIHARLGYTDYEHAEIHETEEHAEHLGEEHEHEEGTVFNNTTLQGRVDLIHKELAGWKGAISFESKLVDFEAIGQEAFTPPSETEEFALSIIEEKHTGDILWQLGARIEHITMNADDVIMESHEEHGEEPESAHDNNDVIAFDEFSFTPVSVSAGVVWDFVPGYNLGMSIARAERAPNAAELFSVGPHIATRAFEAGALFEIHAEDGEMYLEYTGQAEKEVSNNIDISLRKFEGNMGFILNLFYNEISNYYGLFDTGLSSEDIFHHDELDMDAGPAAEDEHAHGEELPVYIFAQQDASLYGMEVELAWQFHPYFKWTVWGDLVRAELDDGEPLPRVSPGRLGTELAFERDGWYAELTSVKYYDQNETAINETATPGYTLLDARISYSMPLFGMDTRLYLAAKNLTDEFARVHTSFLKDDAPLPGRNINAGLQLKF